MLAPPDEKENLIVLAAFLEKRKEAHRAKRVALGLPPDAPVEYASSEEEFESDDEEEEDSRDADRYKRECKYKWHKPDEDKIKEAARAREKGANQFKDCDYEGALESFLEALKADETDIKCELNVAATLMKLDRPRESILAADRALWKSNGKDAKAWYRRGAAWLACGEFNECIADMDKAKSIEPGNKAIPEVRKRAEQEREDATWSFAADEKLASRPDEVKPIKGEPRCFQGNEGAVRTMIAFEAFRGQEVEMHDGVLRLGWHAQRKANGLVLDAKEEFYQPAMLDQRALFCIEEMTKRSAFNTLSLRGCCLGAWGAAFIARGARIQNAGIEHLVLVDCRLRSEGAKAISTLLSRASRLVDLDVSGNAIGDDGLFSIASELKAQATQGLDFLETLKVGRNRIGNARMPVVAQVLEKHKALRTLDLSHNNVTFPGAVHLANGIKESTSIQKMYLGHNKMRADSLFRIAHIAIGHVSLCLLDFRGVKLRKSDRTRIDARTKYTRLMFKIDLPQDQCVSDPRMDATDFVPQRLNEKGEVWTDTHGWVSQETKANFDRSREIYNEKFFAGFPTTAPPDPNDVDPNEAEDDASDNDEDAPDLTGGGGGGGDIDSDDDSEDGTEDDDDGPVLEDDEDSEDEIDDGPVLEMDSDGPVLEDCDDEDDGPVIEDIPEDEDDEAIEIPGLTNVGDDWVYGLAKLGLW